jgi:signal transduction histidine kinase
MTAPTDHPAEEQSRRRSLVIRTIPILLIPFLVSFISIGILRATNTIVPPNGAQSDPLAPIAVLVIFASALIVLVRFGRPTITALLLIGFWTLVTTAGVLRAGVTTFVPAALIIPICTAGLLIDRTSSLSLAGLATVLIASMAWIEGNGGGHVQSPPVFVQVGLPYFSAAFWIGIFWTIAALTSLLAGGLHTALTRSRAQAAELEQLRAQLEARVEAQSEQILSQEREAATMAERARLAREIHDTIAQGLAGVVLQLGAVQRALQAAPDEAPEHIDMAQRMAREALAEARRSVWNLRSPALDHGDLGVALRGLAERQRAAVAEARFAQHGEPYPLAPEVETALLRVAQESLANVAKHAGAQIVQIDLTYAAGRVVLSVRDDGVGFADAQLNGAPAPLPWGGFGLIGIRERLEALGGTLAVRNEGGALIEASIPVAGRGAAEGAV